MTAAGAAAGARTIGDGLCHLDTRELEWEPNGFERAFRKVLSVDEDGAPSAFISYLPGNFSSGHGLPTRHLHHRVHEFSFALGGEYPIWQYRGAEEQHGTLTVLRPGYFFSRLPGSLHGREPGPVSHVGFTSLTWRDRTGNWMFEPEFATESAFVDYEGGWQAGAGAEAADRAAGADGAVLRWDDLTVLDTRAMAWAQDVGVPRKPLWPGPRVELAQVRELDAVALDDAIDNVFVLEGAVVAAGAVLRTGSFLRRRRGARCDLAGAGGAATILAWSDP